MAFSPEQTEARLEIRSNTATAEPPFELVGDERGLAVVDGPGARQGWQLFESAEATLTLPAEFEGRVEIVSAVRSGALFVEGRIASITGLLESGAIALNARADLVDLDVDSGVVDLAGGAEEARLQVTAGSIWLGGEYGRVEAYLDSGWLEGDLVVRQEALLAVSTGMGELRLGAPMPAETTIDVGSGMFELALPVGDYQAAIAEDGSGAIEVDGAIGTGGGADRPKLYLSVDSGSIDVVPS